MDYSPAGMTAEDVDAIDEYYTDIERALWKEMRRHVTGRALTHSEGEQWVSDDEVAGICDTCRAKLIQAKSSLDAAMNPGTCGERECSSPIRKGHVVHSQRDMLSPGKGHVVPFQWNLNKDVSKHAPFGANVSIRASYKTEHAPFSDDCCASRIIASRRNGGVWV